MKSPLFENLDPAKLNTIQQRLTELIHKPSMKTTTINTFTNRREAKLLYKKSQVIEKYFKDQLKPKKISQQLRVPVDFVYRTVDIYKRQNKE